MRNIIKSVLIDVGFCIKNADLLVSEIIDAYSAPGRGYHGMAHVVSMLKQFNLFLLQSGCADNIKNIQLFRFAIVMHDYVNGTDFDIRDSIRKARRFLMGVVDESGSEYVEKLIFATDYDNCIYLDFEQGLMQDLDLNVFCANDNAYDEYSRQIRDQYSQYSDDVFNNERIRILNIFLGKKYIFNTRYYREKYEDVARANLAREIAKLKC